MRGLAFLAIAATFVGCSLFVSLDGLSSGDAGSDAGMQGDAMVGPDVASMDASDAGMIDVYDFLCPDASIVCDDFDDDPLGVRWSSTNISGALMSIDNASAYSPPKSLLLTLPSNMNSSPRNAYLAKTFGPVPTLDCDFDIKVDATDAGANDVRPMEIDLTPGGYSYYELWLSMEPARLIFEQSVKQNVAEAGTISRSDVLVTQLDTSKWHHVHFFTDFKKAKLEVDGITAFDKALADGINPPKGTIKIGLAYDAEPPSWAYRVDDVLCR